MAVKPIRVVIPERERAESAYIRWPLNRKERLHCPLLESVGAIRDRNGVGRRDGRDNIGSRRRSRVERYDSLGQEKSERRGD